jgi:hypothetical protein
MGIISKFGDEMGSVAKMYIPNFTKIGSSIRKMTWEKTQGERERD